MYFILWWFGDNLYTQTASKQIEASGENSSEGAINMNVGVGYKLIA